MNITYKKISEIVPYEKNPRNNDDAVPKVIDSIKEFGFANPIILDKDNVIIAGHTRYKAALKLEMDKVPCIIADHLTKKQVDLLRLVDNKVAEIASWNHDFLNIELEKFETIDLEKFGFVTENLDIDSFFENKFESSKKIKKVKCPNCGEEFEP